MKTFFKKWYRKLLEKAAAELNRITREDNQQVSAYALLSPDSGIPAADIEQYLKALSWALDGGQLKNIALTGPYGSGKSSILLSFQEQYKQYNFLSISLASFAPAKGQPQGEGQGELTKVDVAELEQSIVKQIFYSSDPADIPDTTISRRKGLGKAGLWFLTSIAAVWVLCILYLTGTGFKRQPQAINDLMTQHGNWLDWGAYFLFAFGAVLVLHKSVISLRKFVLDKFKFSTSNLEVEGQNNGSVLNRNIDELLYFFAVKKYHGLIIEDLDRFRNTDIFSNLRALNIILNNSVRFKKKPFVFIYAIQDDLFNVNDRTKFFDFIIPVIPVVNSSNAGEQLLKLLQDANQAENLDASFVLTIGSYVRDMRMVKNIFNEYLFYKEKLGIDAEFKLLGMIAYKNIYPDDFSALHDGKGMIYSVFANKQNVVVNKSAATAAEIKELEARVEKLEAEIAQNVTELNSIYILKIIETLGGLEHIYIGNEIFKPTDLIEPQAFNKLRKETSIQYDGFYTTRRSSQRSFSSFEQAVDEQRSYEDRLSVVSSRQQLDLPATRRLLRAKAVYLERQKSLSLYELLKSNPIGDFSTLLADEPLLAFLLESGGIDELYQLYISNFYEGALKKNDQLFLVDVKNKARKNPDYLLVNIEEMIKRLNADDFSRPEVLNFDLTDFLYKHRKRYEHYFEALSDQLKTGTPEVWLYVQACIDHERLNIFGVMPDIWPEFWRDLSLTFKDLDETLIAYICILLLENVPQRLKDLNEGDVLSSFIRNKFASIRSGNTYLPFKKKQLMQIASRLEELVDILEVTVVAIDGNISLASPVYINSRYTTALGNFDILLRSHGAEKAEETLGKGILTRIFDSNLDAMKAYCQKHISEVVDLLISNPDTKSESSEVAVNLLNSPDLSIEQKLDFVEFIEFRLTDTTALKRVDNEDQDFILLNHKLLTCRKFVIEWENILKLHQVLGLSEDLADFINENESVLKVASYRVSDELDQALLSFTTDFVQSETISGRTYRTFVDVLPLLSEDVLENTPKHRLTLLIEFGLLSFDQEHISLLENDKELLGEFLVRNLAHIGDVELSADHFECLVDQPLSDEQKKLVANAITEERARNHMRLIDALAGYIETGIVSSPDRPLAAAIFESSIEEARKASIFKQLIETYTFSQLIDFLPHIGFAYDQLNTGRVQFANGELDLEILQYLKDHGFIDNFSTSEDTIEITRKTAAD